MHQQDVITYYDEAHGDYKRIWGTERNYSFHYGFFDPGVRDHDVAAENANREVASRARLRPGARVLDAGCGIGGNCIWMARNLAVEAVGLNIQPMQVEMARRLVRTLGLEDRVHIELGDFAKMPFPADSFDALIVVEAMCHAPEKQVFVSEAARVLKPGGRLVVVDYFLMRSSLSRRERRLLDDFLRGWVLPHLAPVGDFGAWLEEAGFRDIAFENTTPRVMPDARRMHRLAVLTSPLTGYREWSGRRSPEEARNRRAAICQYPLLRRGVWAHGIYTAQAAPAP